MNQSTQLTPQQIGQSQSDDLMRKVFSGKTAEEVNDSMVIAESFAVRTLGTLAFNITMSQNQGQFDAMSSEKIISQLSLMIRNEVFALNLNFTSGALEQVRVNKEKVELKLID